MSKVLPSDRGYRMLTLIMGGTLRHEALRRQK